MRKARDRNMGLMVIVFVICGGLSFLLDDCLPGSVVPGQAMIARTLEVLAIIMGEVVLFCGMTGRFDAELPVRARIFWQCVFGLMFAVLIIASGLRIAQWLTLHR